MKIERSKKKVFIKRLICVCVFILSYFITIYAYNKQEQKRKVFESLSVTLKTNPMIEYGTDKYDIEKFVKNASGKVKVTKGNLDSMNVGTQEVVLQVEKNGIGRNFSFKVAVKDTNAPIIKIKESFLSIQMGEVIDPLSNIISVYDLVDGNLSYVAKESVGKDQNNYYTYETDLNIEKGGEYFVKVTAVDKHKNTSTRSFTIKVEEPVVEEEKVVPFVYPPMDISTINISTVANGSKESIIKVAQNLLGLPYVAGGNSPSGFDCSGFVFYVYGINGIPVPRTTDGQFYMGTSVSLEEAMPGDVLVWSANSYGTPTHTAIYIGGGNMIHAANPRKGVIISSVNAYASYGNQIISVRRI